LAEKHSPVSIDTADMQAAAKEAGTDVGHAVANIVLSLAYYEPDGSAAKATHNVSGTVVKANDEDHFLLMVVYDPHRMPLRGADQKIDLASPRVLEKACWRWMVNGAKGGLNHEPGHEHAVKCVENGIYRNPVPWVIDHGDGSRTVIKDGTWIAGFVLDDPTWADYKSGKYGGVSMQGDAGRTKATPEAIERVKGAA
jgi:hypothetical protein